MSGLAERDTACSTRLPPPGGEPEGGESAPGMPITPSPMGRAPSRGGTHLPEACSGGQRPPCLPEVSGPGGCAAWGRGPTLLFLACSEVLRVCRKSPGLLSRPPINGYRPNLGGGNTPSRASPAANNDHRPLWEQQGVNPSGKGQHWPVGQRPEPPWEKGHPELRRTHRDRPPPRSTEVARQGTGLPAVGRPLSTSQDIESCRLQGPLRSRSWSPRHPGECQVVCKLHLWPALRARRSRCVFWASLPPGLPRIPREHLDFQDRPAAGTQCKPAPHKREEGREDRRLRPGVGRGSFWVCSGMEANARRRTAKRYGFDSVTRNTSSRLPSSSKTDTVTSTFFAVVLLPLSKSP